MVRIASIEDLPKGKYISLHATCDLCEGFTLFQTKQPYRNAEVILKCSVNCHMCSGLTNIR